MSKRKREEAFGPHDMESSIRTRSRCSLPLDYKEEQLKLAATHVNGIDCTHTDVVVDQMKEKGEGLVARKRIAKYTFICEYEGEVVSKSVGERREKDHFKKTHKNRYCFYFFFGEQRLCVDPKPTCLALKMNHSGRQPNVIVRVVVDKATRPHLCFFASREIAPDEELLFDYGERRREVIESFKWLKE